MNLVEIKNYVMKVKIASLSHLCQYFNCDSELLRNMLCHWTRKGCIRKMTKTPACGGQCNKCAPAITEIYEWVNTSKENVCNQGMIQQPTWPI